MPDLRNTDLASALETTRAGFVAARPKTVAMHEEATAVMPGGNTRTVLYHGPVPLRFQRGEGAFVVDVDGHRYLSLLGEYTAGLFGHSHPVIRRAIEEALDGGINLAGHNTYEARLAALVCGRFRSVELVRFTNSGTEANLMAFSTARAFTGRSKILVMEGAYHGGVFYFAHGGVPINAPYPFVLGRYNDAEATRALIREHGADLAAVVVEPMMGAAGCIPAEPGFLEMLREEATEAGALLIFDEVMTSRFAKGGAQGLFGITPDMTTLGKYIGGGMSAGGFGGRRDIMAMYDPSRPGAMPHAGTFNNNTLTMAAGIAGLSELFTEEVAEALHARGERLRESVNRVFEESGARFTATGVGSLMSVHALAGPVRNPDDLEASDERLKELLFLDLLEAGFYMAPRGFIGLSLMVTDDDCERFAATLADVIGARRSIYRGEG